MELKDIWRVAVAPIAVVALGASMGLTAATAHADDATTSPEAATAAATTTAGDTAGDQTKELSPTGACSEYVKTPAILDSDTRPDGSPITFEPSPSGKITPVILVHGWVSWVNHDESRTGYFSQYINKTADGNAGLLLSQDKWRTSLIGLMQQTPGVAPYLFDYSHVASRWVTDPEIGPKLGKAITCLSKYYGVKPVIIAHSMGGNATREALAQDDGMGGKVSDHVDQVITFGTPNTGSDNARLGTNVVKALGIPLIAGIPARVAKDKLTECAAGMDRDNTPCTGKAVIDAFFGQGGQALRTGSPEMKALPKWPDNVKVEALAGDIRVGGVTLFGWSSKGAIDMGDLLVSEASATDGATHSNVVRCKYFYASVHKPFNKIKMVVAKKQGRDYAPSDIGALAKNESPCWHESLLRETTQTGIAHQVVSDYAANPVLDEAPADSTDTGK
ncbi:MAG: hypothetical protein E7A62_07050 [Actinomycetaceae bacterium]|nr:hypothetical protein [Actinomycetaceae bacterium]MDU0970735.1 hypothetical protein [Actinomycetaceae bacterium]